MCAGAALQAKLDDANRKLADYRALGTPQEAAVAVRRYRRLTGLWPVRLLRRIYRLFRK